MSLIKKLCVLVFFVSLCGCANKSNLAREYDESLTLNITASEVTSKLSKDFVIEKVDNITETVVTGYKEVIIRNIKSKKPIREDKIKSKIFTLKHKQLKDYSILLFAHDENSKVNLIEISNYMSVAPTNMNAEDRDKHYLSGSQLARVKKDFSFLPCANNKDFLNTDNLCGSNYVVSDDSYDTGGGFNSIILIEPVKK
jgi:hypothetical protein